MNAVYRHDTANYQHEDPLKRLVKPALRVDGERQDKFSHSVKCGLEGFLWKQVQGH